MSVKKVLIRGREGERDAIRKVLDNKKERETDIFIPIPHLLNHYKYSQFSRS